jgi:hypothetical protein
MFGFSNISPSPTTLEITQLELLSHEKRALFDRFVDAGMSEEAAVALVSGAVVAVHPDETGPSRAAERREQQALRRAVAEAEEQAREPEPDGTGLEEGGEEAPA